MKALYYVQSTGIETLENYLRNLVADELRMMRAGSCSLCDTCQKISNQPCAYPDILRN